MKFFRKLELWQALVLPILLILIISAISIYSKSTEFGYNVLESTVVELHQNTKNESFKSLDKYLSEAVNINKLNARLADKKIIDLNDPLELGQYFLEQAEANTNIDFAYYANEAGGITSSGISENEQRLSFTPDMKSGTFLIHTIDDEGQLILLRRVEDFDVKSKSWYTEADQKNEVYWTDVYGGAQDPVLGISTSSPYFDESGNKIGVFGTDILLDEITNYFKTLTVSENTQLYLFESNGNLIVDTNAENPFLIENDIQVRKTPFNSNDPLFSILFENIKSDEWFSKQNFDNTNYYMGVYKHTINEGKSWYLGVAMPESDYISGLNLLTDNLKATFVVSFIILFIVLFIFVKWVNKPLEKISNELISVSKGNFGKQIPMERTDVIGKLTNSFNSMSTTLSTMVHTIQMKNEELSNLNENLEAQVKKRTIELEKMASTDALTELINRRELLEVLEREMSVYKRYEKDLTLAMLDIDFFKNVNDTYGHIEGDKVLISIAQTLKDCMRETDFVGRYGGEEFLVIMPFTSRDEAYLVIERCRTSVENLVIGDFKIKVTVSAGISTIKDDNIDSSISQADENLYKAKQNGRNQTI